MKKNPNIIIFNPDQFRADALYHLGNEASCTPNLDKIIQNDAVSFRKAFCQNPVCTPSRCSFMSGWYTHVRGHRTMHHMMHDDEPVLLKTLKENGYYVWWGGKNDLTPAQDALEPFCHVRDTPTRTLKPDLHVDQRWRGDENEDNYYSFYAGKLDTDGEEVYYDKDWSNIDHAIDIIHNMEEDQPFCIYLSILYPHPPYGVEDPWYSMIDRNKVEPRIPTPEDWKGKPSLLQGLCEKQNLQNWDEERWTELRATYLGMCSRIDHQYGLIVDALKESGHYDDTAIFFFSDHGDFTGNYGLVEKTQNTFEDCLTNVPFIIKPPSSVKVKPGINDALVELIDFPATVEELTGIKPNHTHFGKSLIDVIEGREKEHRDAVFCEGGRLLEDAHCTESVSLQIQNDKNLYWPRLSLQADGIRHTKAVMCRTNDYKYVKRLYEQDELYDLKADPQERINIIDKPDMKPILQELKERLLTFYLETCDVVPHELDKRT